MKRSATRTPTQLGEELSKRLGYEPRLVRKITVTPAAVTVTLYRLNSAGDKYVDDSGEAATYEETWGE